MALSLAPPACTIAGPNPVQATPAGPAGRLRISYRLTTRMSCPIFSTRWRTFPTGIDFRGRLARDLDNPAGVALQSLAEPVVRERTNRGRADGVKWPQAEAHFAR
jgi:hypothetical protein